MITFRRSLRFVLVSILLVSGIAVLSALDLNTVMPRMVQVDGGTFWQGSAEGPYAANERAHQTTLSRFLIAEVETTQALWQAVMGANPSGFKGENRPVENVAWMDVIRFCNRLSELQGLQPVYTIEGTKVSWNRTANGYRLPTEAEWEYAARGGPAAIADAPLQKVPFAGSLVADEVAWFNANSGKMTREVGKKAANELGLFDMSGNVWEWCWDWYAPYPAEAVADPEGPASGSNLRVMRGGAWFTPQMLLRATYRYWNAPTFRVNSLGFRLARNAPAGDEVFSVDVGLGRRLDLYDFLDLTVSTYDPLP